MAKPVVIKKVPAEQDNNFPIFLAGPREVVDPADEPSDRHWIFEFEGRWRNGSYRFFIWQIPGSINQAEDVMKMLKEKAAGMGICCIWIYEVRRPCEQRMVEIINQLNKQKPWLN